MVGEVCIFSVFWIFLLLLLNAIISFLIGNNFDNPRNLYSSFSPRSWALMLFLFSFILLLTLSLTQCWRGAGVARHLPALQVPICGEQQR